MHEAFADRICGGMPDAEREQPFGPDMVVWTIDGHMFAAYTQCGRGLSVRMGTSFVEMRMVRGLANRPAEHTGDGWVLVPWETPPEQLRRMVSQSYDMVRQDGNGSHRS